MKKVLLFVLCCLLLSCAGTREAVKSESTNELYKNSIETQSLATSKVVDTTKTENGKITVTVIEFYPPAPINDTPVWANNAGNVNIPNVGNISNAAIKSIRQTTIESAVEEKGESKESSESKESQKEAIVSNSTQKTDKVVAPAPDPYRWRYIFGILLLAATMLLYLKRVPVFNWIKIIFSGIRK